MKLTHPRLWLAGVSLLWVLRAPAAEADPVKPEPAVPAEAGPTLRNWSPVHLPANWDHQAGGQRVRLRFMIDAQGRVTLVRVLESPDPRLNEPAQAVVRAWRFTPALEDTRPTLACLDGVVEFLPASAPRAADSTEPPPEDRPRLAPTTPVEATTKEPGDYPEALVNRKIAGEVTLVCVVSPDGRAMDTRIREASQVEFALPALDALRRWDFVAAHQGDLPVKAMFETKITFDAIGDSREEILEANHLTAADGHALSALPEPFAMAEPVWPRDALVKGEAGSATVEFTVATDGRVKEVKLREASTPEFGFAALAAVQGWVFRPALDHADPVEVRLQKHFVFQAVPAGREDAENPDQRALAAFRAGQIGPASKLDARLTPVYPPPPLYPAALAGAERTAGKAEIEFVIDRTGRARLPKILSATRPEFGWSAATAISQWVFEPPRRAKDPVDVIVKIPFEFEVPKK